MILNYTSNINFRLTELTKSMKSLEGLKGAQGLQGLKDLQGLQDISKLPNVSKVGGKNIVAFNVGIYITAAIIFIGSQVIGMFGAYFLYNRLFKTK